jgi:L-threonylcarbamoyladenylate synthase
VIVSSAPDIRAPGLLEKHYAPRAGVWLVDEVGLESELRKRTQAGQRLAVLAPRGTPVPQPVVHFEVPADDEGYARELYATLRLVDAREVDVLLVVPPKAAGLGLAVVDRLRRASTRPKD